MVLGIYFLITLLILLDFARVTVLSLSDIPAYFASSMVLGLGQAVLLVATAQGIYFGPATTYKTFLGDLAKHRGHALLLGAFVALVSVVGIFANVVHPMASEVVVDFAGNPVPSTAFNPSLLALMLGLLGFFLAYPTGLMVYASSRVSEKRLRGSLLGLSIGWAAVFEIYVVTEASMWTYGLDATGLMYLANALVFYAVVRNFRRSASIAGFVERTPSIPRQGIAGQEEDMSDLTSPLAGKKVLYQVDPDLPYEVNLRKTLEDLARAGHSVFVFTSRSSPLHGALAETTGVKFFLTTSGVSYMKETDETREVLLPQSDMAIFLDAADKTLRSKRGNVVFLFDSVTDLLLMDGVEETYKFLKQFLELLHEPRSTGLFLLIERAHGAREVNLLRGIFPSHFVEDSQGPRLAK